MDPEHDRARGGGARGGGGGGALGRVHVEEQAVLGHCHGHEGGDRRVLHAAGSERGGVEGVGRRGVRPRGERLRLAPAQSAHGRAGVREAEEDLHAVADRIVHAQGHTLAGDIHHRGVGGGDRPDRGEKEQPEHVENRVAVRGSHKERAWQTDGRCIDIIDAYAYI